MDSTLSATDVGDLVLGLGVRANDARSATLLLERHRDAVASLGPSRFFDTVDASGRRAIALHRSGADDGLPFRALWLALHARGDVPLVEGLDAIVWDAFLALPPAWRLALWHREVEGQSLDRVARHLDLAEGQTALALASAYASLDRRVATALADSAAATPDHAVERALRDVLASAVLGEAAEGYLVGRPQVDPLRVPVPVRPLPGEGRVRPLLAPLGAAGVGAAAIVLVVATSFVNPTVDRLPEAAGDAPVPGTTFTAADNQRAGSGATTRARRSRDGGPTDEPADGQAPSGAPAPPAPTGVPSTPPSPTPPPVPDGPNAPEGPDGPSEPAPPVAVDVDEGGATVTVDTGDGAPVVVEVPLPDAPAVPALPSPPAPLPGATHPH